MLSITPYTSPCPKQYPKYSPYTYGLYPFIHTPPIITPSNHAPIHTPRPYSYLTTRTCATDLVSNTLPLTTPLMTPLTTPPILQLYGTEHVTYAMHLLTHTACSVNRWGPLWSNSAFMFADAGRRLLEPFRGCKPTPMTLMKQFLAQRQMRQVRETLPLLCTPYNVHYIVCNIRHIVYCVHTSIYIDII